MYSCSTGKNDHYEMYHYFVMAEKVFSNTFRIYIIDYKMGSGIAFIVWALKHFQYYSIILQT